MIKLVRLVLAVLFLSANLLHAEVLLGKVVGVSDGDTITLLDSTHTQHKIRLMGIDAPEKAQAYGQASKKSLSDIVFGKDVEISWEKRDRYQRILGKVTLNGQDICLEQVKLGMAWHYKQYHRKQTLEDSMKYDLAEKDARAYKLGLWTDVSPLEPSRFRRAN